MSDKHALIIVDVQHDFLPGGALGVPGGHAVIDPLVALAQTHDLVVCSADNHPPNHCSFVEQGGTWPAHCVQFTRGQAIVSALHAYADAVVRKGEQQNVEAYSAFDAAGTITPEGPRGLASYLRRNNITHVTVGGLATDYCVKATALDAAKLGFQVALGPCRGVADETTVQAIAAMRAAGVEVTGTKAWA